MWAKLEGPHPIIGQAVALLNPFYFYLYYLPKVSKSIFVGR